jgi:hypothetical protein
VDRKNSIERFIMQIQPLIDQLVGDKIVEAEAYFDENVLALTFESGLYVEITVDSVHYELPELDD